MTKGLVNMWKYVSPDVDTFEIMLKYQFDIFTAAECRKAAGLGMVLTGQRGKSDKDPDWLEWRFEDSTGDAWVVVNKGGNKWDLWNSDLMNTHEAIDWQTAVTSIMREAYENMVGAYIQADVAQVQVKVPLPSNTDALTSNTVVITRGIMTRTVTNVPARKLQRYINLFRNKPFEWAIDVSIQGSYRGPKNPDVLSILFSDNRVKVY